MIQLILNFEGQAEKQKLLKKLRNELISAIQTGVGITANEFDLGVTGVYVKPISIQCDINDGIVEED
jgi:hypothetical protein